MGRTPDARVVAGLRLVRLLGSGGEGEVWEARDERGRLRACKLVRPDALVEPAEADRRGRLLERIDHPALVRVHWSGVLRATPGDVDAELDGWGVVEMDLVEGPSLQEAGADPAILGPLAEVGEGLDLLHAGVWSDGVPVVHRDVKPANLVRRRDGSLVLVDPSTLRGVDATHLTRVGTPVFSAPEVLSGRFGPAADVYSFAVTVVALVTGLRGRALADALDDPLALDLPIGVADALARQPHERPATCAEVLEDARTVRLVSTVPTGSLPSRGGEVASGAPPSEGRRSAGVRSRPMPAQDPERARPERARPEPAWPEPAPSGHRQREGDGPLDEAEVGPADEPHTRRPVAGLVLALLVACGVPTALALGTAPLTMPPDPRAPAVLALGAGAVLGLLAHLVARGPVGLLLLAPPLGWAALLADRSAGTALRRAWGVAVLLPGCLALTAAPALAVLAARDPALAEVAAAAPVAGLAAVVLGLAAVRTGGPAGALARLLALPLWAGGALGVLALALAAVPLLVLRGAAGRVLARAGRSLGALVEVARGPDDGRASRASATMRP